MRRFLSILLAAIIALMPLTGMSGTSPVANDAQEMPCHNTGADDGDQKAAPSCLDMKGCCAAVMATAVAPIDAAPAATPRLVHSHDLILGFILDPADRPPASL